MPNDLFIKTLKTFPRFPLLLQHQEDLRGDRSELSSSRLRLGSVERGEGGEAYGTRRTGRAGRTRRLGASATRGAAWFLRWLLRRYRFLLELSMLLLVAARLLWRSGRTAGTSWVRTASALKSPSQAHSLG